MKRILTIAMTFIVMAVSPAFTACSPDDTAPAPGNQTPVPTPDPGPGPSAGNRLRIAVGTVSFTATLSDNAASRAFRAMLPMTVRMDELNGNEKYYYLPDRLQTSASNPGTIHTGDLMLYGSDCLVLFYKTFATSYSYTRLGRLDDTSGLEAALGRSEVTVSFEPAE